MYFHGLIVAGLLLVLGTPGAAQTSADKTTDVTTIRVQLSAEHEARLASQMEGRIVALPRALGERFRKGDLLVGFACDHHKAALAAAEAQYVRTTKNLESRQSLLELQAIPELELELARAEQAQAAAEVARYKAVVSDCKVLAPFSGSVVKVHVNQWETVGRGTVLIHVVNQDSLYIEALIPSSWLSWLAPGHVFTVSVDELGKDVSAEITAIGGRIDPVSQTVPVKARITSSAEGLLPGMSGNARFSPEQ